MDPLSISASIIAVLTATTAVLKQIDQLKARMHVHSELLVIRNSVTDLQATLTIVRDCEEALRNSGTAAAQRSYQSLPNTIDKVQKSLDQLVDFARAKLLKNENKLSRLGLSEKNKNRLIAIRQSISDCHQNLQLVLLAANLQQTPTFLSAIQEAVIIQREQYIQTTATLEQLMSQMTVLQSSISTVHEYRGSKEIISSTTHLLEAGNQMTIPYGQERRHTSSVVRITTSRPLQACDGTCNCQCHVRTQIRTPKWLSGIIGTLFYSSTIKPDSNVRPCNVKDCLRADLSSSSQLTYYFPIWMMRCALVYSTWHNLDGVNSSWNIRIPNEVSYKASCWRYIGSGQLDRIQDLLRTRKMTPFDVRPDGLSVLQAAVVEWRIDICRSLLSAGADWDLKDRLGRTAFDTAWRCILHIGPSTYPAMQLRDALGPDHPYDLCLNPLHRIITGLSSADLEMQLELNPSAIDEGDWIGTTPLMWAAMRDDVCALRSLLSRHANIELRDTEQRTALHYAAELGSSESVAILLNAGADANVADVIGLTPLFVATLEIWSLSEMSKIVSLLKEHGADLEAKDQSGKTTLYYAVELHSTTALDALLKSGAKYDKVVVGLALQLINPAVLKILYKYNMISSWWATNWFFLDDRFRGIMIYGTAKSMLAFADSNHPSEECNVSELLSWIRYIRSDTTEEDYEAFKILLAKKATAIEPSQQGFQAAGTLESVKREDGQDGELEELFEDALEEFHT